MLQQDDLDYFTKRGAEENPRFWPRFGGKPAFKDAVVVDLGCGHGSLCVDIARSGAKRVIGIDLDERRIDFANENLRVNFPELQDFVEFRCQRIEDLPETQVDYFVSKDSFEHVNELDVVLAEMKRRMKLGGRLYSGFSPLWNSPFGDHGRVKVPVPWLHAFIPRHMLIGWFNLLSADKITNLHDLGLNGLSLAQYRRIFQASGLTVVQFTVNNSPRLVSRLFSQLRKLPFCEEYFSHNIYCVLEKRSET